MAQKWIINNGKILISASVEYHKELAKDHSLTIGGGLWLTDCLGLYLYGVSGDFGTVTKEQLQAAIDKDFIFQERFDGYFVYFSTHYDPDIAKLKAVRMRMPNT